MLAAYPAFMRGGPGPTGTGTRPLRVVADVVARGFVTPRLEGGADLDADTAAKGIHRFRGDFRERAFSRRSHA